MIACLNAWAELMKAGLGMVGTSLQAGEMMVASSNVIGSRLTVIGNAARNPVTGDYHELGRMIPEKVTAFSQSGQALVQEWSALLLDASEQVHHFSSLLLRGRAPTADEVLMLADRAATHGTRMITSTMSSGGLALAPVHKKATDNARRLKKRP